MSVTLSQRGKNGIFYVRISYKDIQGKWVEKKISTKTSDKKEAQRLLPIISDKYAYLDYDEKVDKSITVADYLKKWKTAQKGKVEQTTYETYDTYFDKHLIPFFTSKKTKLRDLKALQIQNYCDYLIKDGKLHGEGGLSPVMVRKILSLLKRALDDAIIADYIQANPASPVKVKPLKESNTAQKKHPLTTVGECQQVLDAFKGHYLYPIVVMTLYYGLRRSEVLGLQWKAIDFANDTVTIQHTIVKSKSIIAKDRTKTEDSRATMALVPEVKEILLKVKAEQEKAKEFFREIYEESDYVFTHADGKTYRPDSVTKAFEKRLSQKRLARMRFHDLRHSTASFLFDLGWELNDVREWLRHADIETTANIYTHINQKHLQQMSEKLSNTFQLGEAQ